VICAHAYTWRKNGVVKEAIVLQWAVRIASCDFKPGKKRWAGALLSEKCCCFVRKPSWKSHCRSFSVSLCWFWAISGPSARQSPRRTNWTSWIQLAWSCHYFAIAILFIEYKTLYDGVLSGTLYHVFQALL